MYRLTSTQKSMGSGAGQNFASSTLARAFFLVAFLIATTVQAQDVFIGLNSNGGPEGKGTAYTISSTKTFSLVKRFADWGALPVNDLVRGTDGFLYGMTPNGGTYDHGTLFKISTAGAITILKNFNLAVDGGYPQGSLIQAKDGNFYGLLSSGPGGSGGVIFRITSTGVYTMLKNLSVNIDGGRPKGHLIQATDGNFYGLNSAGGTAGYGTIFRITPAGVYTVLKSFLKTDGSNPNGSLVQASDGVLYGLTHGGGTYNYGVVFSITMAGAFKVIRNLNVATDAAYPDADLIQGKDGWLYGMAPNGVNYNGVAFKINTTGTSLTIIKKFAASTDGGNPYGSLKQGTDGNFYGLTSLSGGAGYSGTAFKLTPTGIYTVLKRFTEATDGGSPFGSLIQSTDGALYGMAKVGGKSAKGTIFKLTTAGVYTVLAHLNGSLIGNDPRGTLALGKDSAYFGVGKTGGTYNFGTIYKICGGVTTVLKSFNRTVDGSNPIAGLLKANDGNLYGVAESGGANGVGTIFRITPTGVYTVLRHFKTATDGEYPQGPLVQGADGFLYGVTYSGGTSGGGTIFKINTSGTIFTVLRHLVPTTDGSRMIAGLTIGTDGAFYGMTSYNPRFFKITAAGIFTVLKAFTYSVDGGTPAAALTLGSDASFYGTMSQGGTYSGGIIFKITSTGIMTKLRHLNPTTDGSIPKASLVQGTDGAFYGTNSAGGTNKVGTIFRIAGTTYTVLRHLNMATDGGVPLGGLARMPKIGLVATAQTGVTTNEDIAKAITLTGTGATNLTFTVVTAPRNGTVTAGTGAARTYTPKANFNGLDSFAFTANVGCISSAPAWVKIKVNAINDAPVLAAIANKTVARGTLLSFIATATDVDAGQTKTFSLITPPTGATINATTGAFSWTPATAGTFTIKVRVTDNGSPVLYNEKSFTVTVTSTALVGTEENPDDKPGQSLNNERHEKTHLYPNPVKNQLNVVLAKNANRVNIIIIDSRGAMICSKVYAASPKRTFQVDVNTLKPGNYYLQVQTETGSETLSFIKL